MRYHMGLHSTEVGAVHRMVRELSHPQCLEWLDVASQTGTETIQIPIWDDVYPFGIVDWPVY